MSDHTYDPSDWHERPQVFDEPYAGEVLECGSGFLVSPGDRAVAFSLVAAELARHLLLQLDGKATMDDESDAREALDAFAMIRRAMVNEAAQ